MDTDHIPSLIGPGFNSTSPARMSNMSSSRPKEVVSIPAFRRFSIDLRFSQPRFSYPRFSDPTRKNTSARRIGGKTQVLVSWHNRLLKKLLLLSNTITRVNSATKGRKWLRARVCCWVALLTLYLALNVRLHSCFFFLGLPLSGLKHRRRRTSGLPTANACQRPILALHWFTSIPIFGGASNLAQCIYCSVRTVFSATHFTHQHKCSTCYCFTYIHVKVANFGSKLFITMEQHKREFY